MQRDKIRRIFARAFASGIMVLTGLTLCTAIATAGSPPRPDSCSPDQAEPVSVTAITSDLDIQTADAGPLRLAGLALPYDQPDQKQRISEELTHVLHGRAQFALINGNPDRWKRRAALLFTEDEAQMLVSVNAWLAARGDALFKPEEPAQSCHDALRAAEYVARMSGNGLWHSGPYSIHPADTPVWPAALDGHYIIVEGKVRRFGLGRRNAYLDFEAARQRGFSVLIPRRSLAQFTVAGGDPAKLAGHRLRVRGTLDLRFGPRMTLSLPEALERLD